MALQWTTEEKLLINIKKGIADGWRMNCQQLYAYRRRLQRLQERALPGYLGCAFIAAVRKMEEGQADVSWPELSKDVEKIQRLLQYSRQWSRNDWLTRLPVLETRQQQYFHTELGEAFIRTLKEKLDPAISGDVSGEKLDPVIPGDVSGEKLDPAISGDVSGEKLSPEIPKDVSGGEIAELCLENRQRRQQSVPVPGNARELEQLASWLMDDFQKPREEKKRKQLQYFSKLPDGAAVAVSACISLCLLSVWLYGQVERNQSFHDIRSLKASAVTQQTFAEKTQISDMQTAERSDSLKAAKEAKGADSRTEAAEYADGQADAKQSAKKQSQTASKPAKRPKILAQYREMAKEYPGLFGWLQIPDTQIDLPVMQPLKEKDFYLHHDFTGAVSAEGALFADPQNNRWPQDGNTVIYGHNMKNGHIFGELDLYEDADYFSAHKEIHFDTIYETGIYEAVAVVKTRILNENEQGFRYYQFFQYDSKEEFQSCLDFIKENQLFDTGSALQYGDRILMLSTCEYSQENGRLLIVARKI